ncbi:AraC family transcriptional regulator [Pseudomonas sp. Marseille-Q5115]|uniref:AraC family transcriptional regulator n=1 Tax=Pseudomonas sp. Marseille-Q5115 TaxID=2866593 RepID=UPI001CE436CA|nr:AraC family transcriptional regulator [Pseudomonas sp. Marseille-Q5115]
MLHSHLTTLNAVSLILDTFRAEGIGTPALLSGSGIEEADLARPDLHITTAQEMQVCANAYGLRDNIGLELGARMHVSSYGMLGYALLLSATFGDALTFALRYPALLGTLFELRLEEDGDLVWLRASNYTDRPALAIFNAELCMASLRVICNDVLGQPLPLKEARFSHALPHYADDYQQAFNCPLRFGCTDNAFAFEREWLAKPLPLADAVTHGAMAERCRRQNSEFTGRQAWLGRIRQALARQLHAPPGLEGLARQMKCSGRTLRRRLQDVGSSYQDLLDDLRFEQAKHLLVEARLPVYRIAEQLGFSETASFRHAFIRWSGVSPSAFRA